MPIWSLPRSLKIGERVHHFRILAKLGEGGMGEVYAAFDETLERKVALKAIHRSHALDDMARERFQREARTLSALDHPGICRIHDYVRAEHGDFLVLELLEGRTLHDEIAAGVSRKQALDLAEQLAAVLAVAHEAGIVHRDLKPGNVMVTPDGVLKVLDFGLSRSERAEQPPEAAPAQVALPRDDEPLLASSASALHTSPGTVLGTLPYMSPEQARGEPVTAATDLFAMGLILQELVTGQPGHPRDLDFAALLERVTGGRVDVSPRLSRELGALVRALTRIEPGARPPAQHVLERLRWIRRRPSRVLRRSIAAALVLAGALAWLKYTVDLSRRERELADLNVDLRRREIELEELNVDLRVRERQAEDLIDYLVVDLREKLVPIGRLDLLADLGQRALAYFGAVPEEDWTDAELTRRCKAFYQLGDVLSQQGDRAGAMEFFQPARAFAAELVRRDATNQEWLFELGQLQFYVGQVHFELDDVARARPWFEDYLATSRKLVALDPERPDYRIEVAYGITNMGALALKEARWSEAAALFDEAVGIWRALVRASPDDAERRYELADALSWLAENRERTGELSAAIAAWREELALREELFEIQPEHATWEYLRSTCHHHLAAVLEAVGELDEAVEHHAAAVVIARELSVRDASNAEWQRHLGAASTAYGRVLVRSRRLGDARSACADALDVLDRLCRIDPSNGDWRVLRVNAHVALAEAHHADGDPVGALEATEDVLDELALGSAPEVAADLHLLRGRAFQDLGEEDAARAELEEVLSVLDGRSSSGPALEQTRIHALVRLGRHAEAARGLDALEARGIRSPYLRTLLEAER